MLFQTDWYAMLASDKIRALAGPFMPARLFFIRAFGREVSCRHGVENTVEQDLSRVLGRYYHQW